MTFNNYKISSILFLLFLIEILQYLLMKEVIFFYIALNSFLGFIIFKVLKERLNTFFSYFILTILITYSVIPALFFTFSQNLIDTIFGFKSLLSIRAVFISLIPITIFSLIYNHLNLKYNKHNFSFITTKSFNFKLFSLIFLELFIEIINDAYYTKGMIGNENVNYDFLNNYSFLMFLKPLSFVGILLQIIRYSHTKDKKDFKLIAIMNLIVIVCYLPSGSRENTFIIFIATILFYIRIFQNTLKLNIIKFVSYTFLFMLIIAFIGIWRVASVHKFKSESFIERIQNIYKIYENKDDLVDIFETNSPLERFNEFNQIGDIVYYKNINRVGPVYFENLEYLFLSFIPSVFRPIKFDFNDGAIIMQKYNLNDGVGGSVPISVHGDMYHRFGYFGFIFLFILMFPYLFIDFISYKKNYLGIIFSGIYFFQIIRLNTQSLLKHTIVFSRDFLFTYLLSFFIFHFILKYAKKEYLNY